MKAFIVPSCIIAFIVALVIANFIVLKSTTGKLTDIIDNSMEKVQNNNFKESIDEINLFEKEYKKYEGYFSTIVRHSELDEIRILSKRLSYLCTAETKEDFLAESNALKDMINHLYYSEQISINNIL